MSFGSILKRIGSGVLPIASAILGVTSATLRQQTQQSLGVAKAATELDQIGVLVQTAEAVGQQVTKQLAAVPAAASGSGTIAKLDVNLAKAEALLPSVKAILQTSSLLTGHVLVDPERFATGSQKVLDGIVDILDSYDAAESVASANKTPPPAATQK